MTYSFNLIDHPWIPCTTQEGKYRELSLRQVFDQAHTLRAIAGDSPLETAAIYRLLLAILHSALRGPESAAAWNELWLAGTWDTPWLNDYLDRWRHRFDLFDPKKPFYQADDQRVKPKSIISLAMDMASGNNASLFDHHTESEGVQILPAKAARILIVAQTFSLAGLSGLEQKFTDAPWGRGIIFLIEGDNLFQTLALNCLRYGGDYPVDIPALDQDLPAWEADDAYIVRDLPLGYLDYLTWQNRRIMLKPEGDISKPYISQVTVAPGLRMNASLLDPFKYYRKDEKKGSLVTRFSEGKILWRDSSVLFNVQESTNHPPANIAWIANLADKEYIEPHLTLRCMALGMANDQAKVEFYRQEHLPLPVEFLENSELVGKLNTALLVAEETRKMVWSASNWMSILMIAHKADENEYNAINSNTKEQAKQLYSHWSVESDFWSALEIPFSRLLEGLPDEPELAMLDWKKTLKKTAWFSFEKAANQAGDNTYALKASVRARGILSHGLNELFPDLIKEVIE